MINLLKPTLKGLKMLYYNPYTDEIAQTKSSNFILIGIPDEEPSSINTAFKNGVQFAWDSTSIGLFKTCPRKYELTIIKGYVPRIMPPPLAFGIHLHTLLQTWHKLVESNLDRHTALMRVTKLAGLLGETLPSGDTARTKQTLVRTIVWYLEQFWDDKAVTVKLTNNQPAVEYHFFLLFMSYMNHEIFLCGHIDRIVQWQLATYACDYKTTKYSLDGKFFSRFKPSTQMSLYTLATHLKTPEIHNIASAHGVIIDGIQLGVNFSRFARQVVTFSLEEINEYIESLKYWITQAINASVNKFFAANEESCGQYGGCPFREICSMPPARREAYLKGNFKIQMWNPVNRRN